MPRIVGVTPLHYGTAYLPYALRAIEPFVDKVIIAYTAQPSYGHPATLPIPAGESEAELRATCDFLGNKLEWHSGQWTSEGAHRNETYRLAGDCDLILQVDSDEIFNSRSLDRCLKEAYDGKSARYGIGGNPVIEGLGWCHFFRSFSTVCYDAPQHARAPVRILKPSGEGVSNLKGTVCHMGYAIPDALLRYKLSCHGHHNELRPGWIHEVWDKFPDVTTNVHPVSSDGFWNIVKFVKELLPDDLKAHPFYDLDVIR
jgi:hypothetical protein